MPRPPTHASHAPVGAELRDALLNALFAQTPFSVAVYDLAGRVVTANAAYERHWGIRLADVPADFSLFTDPQLARDGLLPLLQRAYAGVPVLHGDGALREWVGANTDVTDQREGPVTEPQREDLARIRRSRRHLLGLINEVLNYARVEAGAVRYETVDVPVAETLLTCEALTTPQLRAEELTLDLSQRVPGLRVRADREKLQQILLNLLSDAVKFTPPGGRVALRCAHVGTDAGADVAIAVADTGPGIAADQLERVFEPFVQVDASRTRTQEGVGLDLAISHDLARGMGGDLVAESVEGEGSTFTPTLPAA